jgi:hypothetical protein
MSILWIILIVVLVLALLGFFSRGYCEDQRVSEAGWSALARPARFRHG